MVMSKKLLTPALAALALVPPLAAPSWAMPFSERALGTEFDDGSAREAAMGGTGASTASGVDAVAANPARMVGDPGFALHVGGWMHGDDERRSFPVHDSFSGYIADNIYALNADHNAYGSASLVWNGEGRWTPAVGLSVRPSHVYDYRYEEIVLSPFRFRSNFPEEIRGSLPGQNIVDDFTDLPLGQGALYQSGRMDRYSLAFAEILMESDLLLIDVGLGLDFYRSSAHAEASVHYDTVTVVNQLSGEIWEGAILPYPRQSSVAITEGRATGFNLGLNAQISDRLEIAVSHRIPGTLEIDTYSLTTTLGDSTSTLDISGESIQYPTRTTIGVVFHPKNEVRTTVAAQMDYETSSSSNGPGRSATQLTDECYRWRVGVEHLLPGGVPLRFGFAYGTTTLDETVHRTLFTAGTGFAVGPAYADISGTLGYATYRTPDLFDDALYGMPSRVDQDRIEERSYRAVATLRWPFF